MAHSVREPAQPYVSHVRPAELIRPERQPHVFPKREAQRRLLEKERHWAPVAYAVFAAAILLIFAVAYTTYVFSRYRGEVLPGVYVDSLSVSGMTATQADNGVQRQLATIHRVPLVLTYGPRTGKYAFRPTAAEIGVAYPSGLTGKAAMNVGREGPLIDQLIDRLPIHPTHVIPVIYQLDERQLRAYIRQQVKPKINQPAINAKIIQTIDHSAFQVKPAVLGLSLDVERSVADIRAVLGALTKQTVALHASVIQPAITNQEAQTFVDRVNGFLTHPPVIAAGKRVFPVPRAALVPMFSFRDKVKPQPFVKMTVDQSVVQQYISTVASQIDQPAQNARMDFSGGKVIVIQPLKDGRSLDQAGALQSLLGAVTSLHPNARLHFKVSVTQPPVDVSNPASLGINTLLGEGITSFKGAGQVRLDGVMQIAQSLNQDIIHPDQEISLNTLSGTGWNSRVYDDRETQVSGQLVPGGHGAMQQVATTFLRAMYSSGLTLLERHAHPYQLAWYQPPFGFDAVVAPGRNWDLRFANSTHNYLLIETRVEPIRQELYIYVYGANQGWKVTVDSTGKVVRTYPHGTEIVQHDPSLPPGVQHQVAWAHDGADVVLQRTIVYRNHKIQHDQLVTHYQPEAAILIVGSAKPTPTPTPSPSPTGTPSASATPGASPTPTPTATFNH